MSLLQIFFTKDQRLGTIVDTVQKLCTIDTANPMTRPIVEESPNLWYCSLHVKVSRAQLEVALRNSGHQHLRTLAVDNYNQTFLVSNQNERVIQQHSFMLLFQNGKLKAETGYPVNTWTT